MEKKHKVYIKLNLMSLFFIAVSFISVTLAWFAYSGLTDVSAEFGVKAWYIEFKKNGTPEASNQIEITSNIYPGMQTVDELVNINNPGDSDASLSYDIVSARILDTEYVVGQGITSEELEDKLSHYYPFHININLSRKYVEAKGSGYDPSQEPGSVFDVSISWPLDSGANNDDSLWGNNAYEFQKNETTLYGSNARPAIEIIIKVTAEQYLTSTATNSDMKYNLGDIVLYDVENNHGCTEVGGSCIRTHVIDVNSTLGDDKVSLLPDIYGDYSAVSFTNYKETLDSMFGEGKWNVGYRELTVDDLMNIISNDIKESVLIRDNLSDSIIGSLTYTNRMEEELAKVILSNGHYQFLNSKYSYLISNTRCFWTSSNYDTDKAFAFAKKSETTGKIYGEQKGTECSVIPILEVYKAKVEQLED